MPDRDRNKQTSNKQINSKQGKNGTEKKNFSNRKSYEVSYNKEVYNQKPNYYLIPIFIIICIIPLIVRYAVYKPNMSQFKWFPDTEYYGDIFLYYKHWTFVITAGIMALIIGLTFLINRKKIRFFKEYIPLAVYGALALLSAAFSKYAFFCFSGSFEQFESIFAILGYCIAVYYAYLFVNSEKDLKYIAIFIIAIAIVLGILGTFQFLGHDFFASDIAYQLIMPKLYQDGNGLTMNFEKCRVYLTLYNPNYVGVYVALIVPILVVLLFFQRNIWLLVLSIISVIGLLVCAVGSGSLASFIGLGIAVFFILILMWRYLLKRFYITIPVIIVLVISLGLLNYKTDQILLKKFTSIFTNTETNYALKSIDTLNDRISLNYNGNKMNLFFNINDNQTADIIPVDEDGNIINCTYDSASNSLIIADERFTGITIGVSDKIKDVFYIAVEGKQWYFTNQTEDHTYYYINRFGKLDKMITAASAVFTGHEWFASGRAYIWSRTIPLLKKHIYLGSGPDTYTMEYPQQDYLKLIQSGFGDAILTKPHSLYLQIATQTGVLSLAAFLIFYGMYFISSICLYVRGKFSSIYAKYGLAIFVGTIAYMVTGLTNDSTITVAPVYWTLMGIGLAVNHKAKPLIREEVAQARLKRLEKKQNISSEKNA